MSQRTAPEPEGLPAADWEYSFPGKNASTKAGGSTRRTVPLHSAFIPFVFDSAYSVLKSQVYEPVEAFFTGLETTFPLRTVTFSFGIIPA